MSGPPRVRLMNVADYEPRPVLEPTGNKARPYEIRKPVSKSVKKPEKVPPEAESKDKRVLSSPPSPLPQCVIVPSILRQQDRHQAVLNLSMCASCSSDASSDSSHSRASSGKGFRRSSTSVKKKHCGFKTVEKAVEKVVVDSVVEEAIGNLETKKRCAWVTPNTDPCYAAFHDEEWGVPVHDDKKLFELLSLSGALAELTWPVILNKRDQFRETFLKFDPFVVSKLSEKKMTMPGAAASYLLSEVKVRAIIENARQMCKVIDEFGSFISYIWNFVNHKPIVNHLRYARQVPVKTPKAEVISKDLVRRGFRSVGPTVVYTFMQVSGLTNDHLISCFRFQECAAIGEASAKGAKTVSKTEQKILEGPSQLELEKAIGKLELISK